MIRSIALLAALPVVALPAFAAGPDLIVADIPQIVHWGEVDGVHAYSFSVTACNIGDAEIEWAFATNRHPVRASQLYRLADGRFEQIGLAWVKHEFAALQSNFCGFCEPAGSVAFLGVGCSTVDSASIAGAQSQLGARTDISAADGAFDMPFTGFNETGNAVFKRLRASEADLSVPGARYFVEGQFIAPDDAEAGNGDNNASWREVSVQTTTFNMNPIGTTMPEQPAVFAWQQADPGVTLASADAPDGGRYWVGSNAAALEGGQWQYEYAVMNLNSSMPAMRVEVPLAGGGASDLGFHDVDYHSGEAVDDADWAGGVVGGAARWSVQPPPLDEPANTLRWGTLYNVRFVSATPPGAGSIDLLLDDGVSVVSVNAVAPAFAACSPADVASPFGVLDLADVQAFISAFIDGNAQADLAEPFGVLDLADVQAFVGAFNAGCE